MKIGRRVAAVTILCVTAAIASLPGAPAVSADRLVNIVALGDSLVAGYGLPGQDAFPVKLERVLVGKGIAVKIANAGLSGDTASGGLSRLDWSVPNGTDAVILELGANDALRGIDPQITRKALDAILRRLQDRKIPVLLCGMLAPPNLGPEYGRAFNSIYPDLAARYGALLYPFFLAGVATYAKLTQPDGLHPAAAGVDVIVEKITPLVEQLVARVRAVS